MSNRVEVTGMDDGEMENVVYDITNALASCGISYPVISIQWNNDRVIPVNLLGEYVPDATSQAIDLPPLRQLIEDWQNVIVAVSKAVPNTTVSLVVNGEVQVALNGAIL